MSAPSSHGAATRQPVYSGTKRVTGLWVRTLADGSERYELQRRVEGKVRKLILPGPTKSDAIEQARNLSTDLDRGDVLAPSAKVATTEAIDAFIASMRSRVVSLDPRRRRSSRTVDLYEQRLAHVRLPRTLSDVDVSAIRRVIETLEAEGKAPATVGGYLVALGSFLGWAKREKLIRANPVSELDSTDRPSSEAVRPKRFLSESQVSALLAEMTDVFRPVAATLAYSGLRVSEALALRWGDIEDGVIQVERQLGTEGNVVPLKTNDSEATVPLLPALARELQAHRVRAGRRFGFGAIGPDALLFATPSGVSPGRRNVHRAIARASEKAGIGHVGPHDLRRTFVSQAVGSGMDIERVRRLARHTTIRTTALYVGSESPVEELGGELVAGGFGG